MKNQGRTYFDEFMFTCIHHEGSTSTVKFKKKTEKTERYTVHTQ